MTHERIQNRVGSEIRELLNDRLSLHLSSLTSEGEAYASYAPYALDKDCLYVLISELAIHALNLQQNPRASVLIIEDEATSHDVFARRRVNYSVQAELIRRETAEWKSSINLLRSRHGELVDTLCQLGDFKLFCLIPLRGRYIKGFGKAFAFEGATLTGESMHHLRGEQ